MKILNPDMSDEVRQEVKEEIKAIQNLAPHRNLVQIYKSDHGAYIKTKPNGKKIER